MQQQQCGRGFILQENTSEFHKSWSYFHFFFFIVVLLFMSIKHIFSSNAL